MIKRRNSLDLDSTFEKKTKYNFEVSDFIEASRLFNTIIDRLDQVEEECNRLDTLNTILTKENKEINNKHSALASKHNNLLKNFDLLKLNNDNLNNEIKTLATQVANQNNDDMNGTTLNQLTTTSFADLLKGKNKNTVSEPMVEIINTMNSYSNQKRGRENNVIIFGLENVQKENVNNRITGLFTKLKANEIKFNNPVLLIKNGTTNTSPPIKITLENEEAKFKLLKIAKGLREINHNDNTRINISQDLNDIDRQMNKKLLLEKKAFNGQLLTSNISDYYYGIRGCRIVKITK